MRKIVAIVFIACCLVYLLNSSLLVKSSGAEISLLAHRGLSQLYDRQGLKNDTCTAQRMIETSHDYIENTIAGIAAAFQYGVDVVEFDVHPTTDGHFAVFHDWTLDCRTNGTGVTRAHTLAELKALDIGYGYTMDGGQSWPFRGKGVSLMPSLDEVLDAFPNQQFLINIKSNDPVEGELLAKKLKSLSPERLQDIQVYGGVDAIKSFDLALPLVKTFTAKKVKKCLTRYVAIGWSGYIPQACRNAVLLIPYNFAPWLWGWPNRFQQRMAAVDTELWLTGYYDGNGPGQGFDNPALLDSISPDYSGGIWTDRADIIGPALEKRGSSD